jgi:hypothetical protein
MFAGVTHANKYKRILVRTPVLKHFLSPSLNPLNFSPFFLTNIHSHTHRFGRSFSRPLLSLTTMEGFRQTYFFSTSMYACMIVSVVCMRAVCKHVRMRAVRMYSGTISSEELVGVLISCSPVSVDAQSVAAIIHQVLDILDQHTISLSDKLSVLHLSTYAHSIVFESRLRRGDWYGGTL